MRKTQKIIIPELREIENTKFVDNMSFLQCEDFIENKLGADVHIYTTHPFKAVMPDGSTFATCNCNMTEAAREVAKECIDHYLLTNRG